MYNYYYSHILPVYFMNSAICQNELGNSGNATQKKGDAAKAGQKEKIGPFPLSRKTRPKIVPNPPEKNKTGPQGSHPNHTPATAINFTSPKPKPSFLRIQR